MAAEDFVWPACRESAAALSFSARDVISGLGRGMIENSSNCIVSHIHAWLLLLELASARGLLQLLASGSSVSAVFAVRPPLVLVYHMFVSHG